MCPYGTYQRALSSTKLTIAEAVVSPEKFRDAMLTRLSKKGLDDKQFVERFLECANEHLQADYQNILAFRL